MEAQSAAAALAPSVLLRALLAGALTGLVGGAYRLLLDGIEPWRARVVAEHGSAWVFWLALAGLVVASAIRDRGPAALALCVILAVGITADFRLTPQPYLDWPDASACIGESDPCVVPVFPVEVFSLRWPGPDGVYDSRGRATN